MARRFKERIGKPWRALGRPLARVRYRRHCRGGRRIELRAAFCRYLGAEIPEDALHVHQSDILRMPHLDRLLRATALPRLQENDRLLVIGNPPYVEAKRLGHEAKAALAGIVSRGGGRSPDLYLYFLHACLDWLRPADTLAFVLPNKLLVNANAQKIRERLLNEGRLRSLWFATQASIFPDAAVYPIVLLASGPSRGQERSVEIVPITRIAGRGISQGERVTVDPARYRQTRGTVFFPLPETPVLRDALERLLHKSPRARLGSVLDIRWAISFHRAGLREQYVLPHRLDDPCARPFIGGGAFAGNGEVTRYQVQWAGWWIRYDAAELQARKNPVPELGLFERPKVVICQNGRTLRAAYDDQGFVLKDTFLCGAIRGADHPLCRYPRALVGLLCSRTVHFFYAHVFYGGHVNGGYLHFLRSFLVDIPLGTWSDESAGACAKLVWQRERATTTAEREALEEQMEAIVAAALGLSEAEQNAIAAWAAGDANWQARERIREPKAAGD